ncbi:hypothetical protein [Nostoc sp. PCC 9305]|uniref:hypothetical protein n=1 Tax=Nostoc sp. PCC 9305 TaxID=296636 RepID=UPI0039C5CA79
MNYLQIQKTEEKAIWNQIRMALRKAKSSSGLGVGGRVAGSAKIKKILYEWGYK